MPDEDPKAEIQQLEDSAGPIPGNRIGGVAELHTRPDDGKNDGDELRNREGRFHNYDLEVGHVSSQRWITKYSTPMPFDEKTSLRTSWFASFIFSCT